MANARPRRWLKEHEIRPEIRSFVDFSSQRVASNGKPKIQVTCPVCGEDRWIGLHMVIWRADEFTAVCRPCRTRQQAQLNRKHHYDFTFFKEWTSANAYVLGALFADGHVSPDRIAIGSKDVDWLTEIANAIGYTEPLSEPIPGYAFARLTLHSTKMAKDVQGLGLLPHNSRTMKWPDPLDFLLNDFIRGYFDGDGSVWESGKKKRVMAQFCSGSKGFLIGLDAALQRAIGLKGYFYTRKGEKGRSFGKRKCDTHDTYMLSYSSRPTLRKLYWLMYPPGHGICLQRKKDKFKQAEWLWVYESGKQLRLF